MSIGLYIHVPFCVKKCRYCDFVSYPYDAGIAVSYLSALEREIAIQAEGLTEEHKIVGSIYVGGGTPTLLTGGQIKSVLNRCSEHFKLKEDAEITVECNPGTVDLEKLQQLRLTGINRISIGLQACQQEMLSILGRGHTWPQVVEVVGNSKKAGFDNLSLDLISGIPGQTLGQWKETLERVVELSPQHVSAYNLKIEPDTPLHRDVSSGYIVPCDEELELEMFWHTRDFLLANSFEHYEISNFALPGWEARHNIIYWQNEEYLGFGPAAHSMMNSVRFSNVESVALYISRIENSISSVKESLRLSREEQISESVFLGLRLIKGLNLDAFEKRFGLSVTEVYGKEIDRLLAMELIEIKDNFLRLTKKGLPLANEAFAEFV
jgi:oxygen-independent coproporphyrinogen-3 oxidase